MQSRSFSRFPVVALTAFVLGAPGAAQAATIHVPADEPTIQDGLNAAASTDTVMVAPGTYAGPGNRDLDFAGKAIRLFSLAGAANTIIDCGGSPTDFHRGILFDDGELGAFVDGFRFVNGYAPASGGLSPDGGAILVDGGGLSLSVIIRECEFFRNTAEENGGAIAVRGQGTSATLIKCRMAGNTAIAGGALAVRNAFQTHLTECSLTGNLANGGGAIFIDNATVTGNLNTITGNHATSSGGAVFGIMNADLGLDYSIIWGNCADIVGDAIYIQISGNSIFNCCDIDTFGVITAGSSTVTYDPDTIDQDPLFCGAVSCTQAPTEAGWYALSSASPCLAANNSCGQDMGRYGFGCSSLGTPGDEEVRDAAPRLLASPNPARGQVRITTVSGAPSRPGTLFIYSVSGQLVRSLPVGRRDIGLEWDGRAQNGERVAAGLYLLRLSTAEETLTGRVILAP